MLDRASEPTPKLFPKALLAVLPLIFTVEMYIPSETYFYNCDNFLFVYFDFAPILLIKTILFSLTAATALCAMKTRISDVLIRLCIGLTLCFYVQYMFMNSSIPTALGNTIDWDQMHSQMIVNALVWVGLLLIPFIWGVITKKVGFLSGNKIAVNAHIGAAVHEARM